MGRESEGGDRVGRVSESRVSSVLKQESSVSSVLSLRVDTFHRFYVKPLVSGGSTSWTSRTTETRDQWSLVPRTRN